MTLYSRRKLLATGAAGGLAAAAVVTAAAAEDYSAAAMSDPGPHDPAEAAINPYDWQGLPTDHGNLGTLRHSFSEVHNRHTDAGWAREVTVRNFPISKNMAGVNMRLPTGAVRELHWHVPAEWAFVTYGSGRITAVDSGAQKIRRRRQGGRSVVFPRRRAAFDPGPRARRLRIRACLQRRQFLRGLDLPDHRLVQSHAKGSARREFRRSGLDLRQDQPQGPLDLQRAAAGKPRRRSGAEQPALRAEPLRLSARRPEAEFPIGLAAPSASPIQPTSRRPPWPPRWSRLRRAACANCTGIRCRTNGNITSAARRAWASSMARDATIRSSSIRATSAMCRNRSAIMSEHRQGHAALPRGVHLGAICRHLAGVVDEQRAARARRGASQHRRRDAAQNGAGQDACCAGIAPALAGSLVAPTSPAAPRGREGWVAREPNPL